MHFTRPIEDVLPGQTVLCHDEPSLVLHNARTPIGNMLTFFSPTSENVVGMFEARGTLVTIAPLAPTA